MSLRAVYTRPQWSRLMTAIVVGGTAATLTSQYLVRRADADSNTPAKVFGKGPAFVSLSLEHSEYVSKDTKRLRFSLPTPDSISGLPLTSALLTLSWPKGQWFPVARPYTPITSENEPGILELMVKQYPNGKQSTHLHSLSAGDKLLFAVALPGFKWRANYTPHVTLIAGGAGITPIYQLAQGILDNPEDRTTITLIHGVNTEDDMVLNKELQDFMQKFPDRLKVFYTVSQPSAASSVRKGRITGELIQEVAHPSNDHVFICGPPAMEEVLVGSRKSPGILQQLGYSKDRIHQF